MWKFDSTTSPVKVASVLRADSVSATCICSCWASASSEWRHPWPGPCSSRASRPKSVIDALTKPASLALTAAERSAASALAASAAMVAAAAAADARSGMPLALASIDAL
eukprot:6190554-Pleurochrysis_carterae.AAC.1